MEAESREDEPTADAPIARALAARDPGGLEQAYRRYADRLHAYCRSMLRDSDAAADAVHDTFVVASQRAGELRDPSRLRSWLYAVARNECLRALRARRRQAPLAEAETVSADQVDPVSGLRAEELRELVRSASAALPDNDREAIELALRHDLSAAEVGAVLGVSANHAHARLSRARAQLEKALGALLVARTGAGDCEQLRALLTGWDGQLTSLLRKRLARHISACAVCAERQRRQLHPSALLSGYATLPFALVSEEVWTRLRLTCGEPGEAGGDQVGRDLGHGVAGSEIAARAGRFSRATGFPIPLDQRRRGAGWWRVAVAAVLALLVIGGVALLAPHHGVGDATWLPPSEASSPSSGAPVAAPPSPSADMASSSAPPSPAASVSPESPGSPSPEASPDPDLTVKARGVPSVCRADGWKVDVTAYVGGGEPETVTLYWRTGSGDRGRAPMRRDGARWVGATGLASWEERIQWWVSAATAGGGRGQTEPKSEVCTRAVD